MLTEFSVRPVKVADERLKRIQFPKKVFRGGAAIPRFFNAIRVKLKVGAEGNSVALFVDVSLRILWFNSWEVGVSVQTDVRNVRKNCSVSANFKVSGTKWINQKSIWITQDRSRSVVKKGRRYKFINKFHVISFVKRQTAQWMVSYVMIDIQNGKFIGIYGDFQFREGFGVFLIKFYTFMSGIKTHFTHICGGNRGRNQNGWFLHWDYYVNWFWLSRFRFFVVGFSEGKEDKHWLQTPHIKESRKGSHSVTVPSQSFCCRHHEKWFTEIEIKSFSCKAMWAFASGVKSWQKW